jgi:short-subunit dehydrogenase
VNSSTRGTALITGASRGIGALCADRLVRRVYDLILVARSEAQLKGLANSLHSETGRQITPLMADLAVRADSERIGKLLVHGNTTCLPVARLEGQ